jgi:hypothetical protein
VTEAACVENETRFGMYYFSSNYALIGIVW